MRGEAGWERAALQHEQAVGLWLAGRLEAAAQACEQALHGLREAVGDDHPDLGNALDTAALIALDQGRPRLALPRAEAAVALLSVTSGEPVLEAMRAGALRTLGVALRMLGRLEEAELRLTEAVKIAEAAPDADPAGLASSLSALGICLREAGRLDEAEVLYRRALALDPGSAATLLHNLAGLACTRGRPEEAVRLARQGLQARAGADPLQIAADRAGLGVYLAAVGQEAEGEALLRQALGVYTERLPALHPERAFLLHNLAELLLDAGRPEEALERGLEALSIKESSLGEAHPEVAATLCTLCIARLRAGEDGRALLARAERIVLDLPEGHPIRQAVGRVAGALGQRA